MKRLALATAMALSMAGGAVAQDTVTVSTLTAQGKVLLATHFTEATDIIVMVLGTVEGGPEVICRTRYRGGNGYDECRKMQ